MSFSLGRGFSQLARPLASQPASQLANQHSGRLGFRSLPLAAPVRRSAPPGRRPR